jgi:very-short-patch-repair endonuclease
MLPQLCHRCRKLKSGDLGRFTKVPGRCHERRWICQHCESKTKTTFSQCTQHRLSPIERQAAAAIAKTGFSFKSEYPLGKFRLDFVIPALGLAIEVDSRTWHSHASRLRRDAVKTKLAVDSGLKLVRVRAPDIGAKIDAAVQSRLAEL